MEPPGYPPELILAVEKERKKKMDVKMAVVWAGVIAGSCLLWGWALSRLM